MFLCQRLCPIKAFLWIAATALASYTAWWIGYITLSKHTETTSASTTRLLPVLMLLSLSHTHTHYYMCSFIIHMAFVALLRYAGEETGRRYKCEMAKVSRNDLPALIYKNVLFLWSKVMNRIISIQLMMSCFCFKVATAWDVNFFKLCYLCHWNSDDFHWYLIFLKQKKASLCFDNEKFFW